MDTTSIINKTYDLIDAIKQSEIYQLYLQYEERVLNDTTLQNLLADFHKKKDQFEEAYQYGTYYPDFNNIRNDYQQAKISLMDNDLFRKYKAYEKEVDLFIFEIETRLKNLLNIKDKHSKVKIKL